MPQYSQDRAIRCVRQSHGLSNFGRLRKALPRQERVYKREWVYGFWMKNKYLRRLAEKKKLNWQNRTPGLCSKLMGEVTLSTGVFFNVHPGSYRGQTAMIVGFVKDDERRRLERNEFSDTAMEKVRRRLGLPEGTKPRWYELSGVEYDPNEELESEDEEFPESPEEKQYNNPEIYPKVSDNVDLERLFRWMGY
ncbi:uncharacterized protein FOMMEDRAFT_31113 [Fomitiporia mediterranea MF3/22]|uniref:uncharacterized protein n=1 Tax=Fomitiporia mediterranea (strain MF3/22) TaxID=694068 RepID=UPI000440997C|nr:uncharacterized protein FOMMEDRAFT_31113 [Fomitiporia mediterranea MF3/22]EJC99882.1 hypothetical protein FOMMEDRAFT_31113 [Fomitiporia mediterranea MF3/22]